MARFGETTSFVQPTDFSQQAQDMAAAQDRMSRLTNRAFREANRRNNPLQALRIAQEAQQNGVSFGGIQRAGAREQAAEQALGRQRELNSLNRALLNDTRDSLAFQKEQRGFAREMLGFRREQLNELRSRAQDTPLAAPSPVEGVRPDNVEQPTPSESSFFGATAAFSNLGNNVLDFAQRALTGDSQANESTPSEVAKASLSPSLPKVEQVPTTQFALPDIGDLPPLSTEVPLTPEKFEQGHKNVSGSDIFQIPLLQGVTDFFNAEEDGNERHFRLLFGAEDRGKNPRAQFPNKFPQTFGR